MNARDAMRDGGRLTVSTRRVRSGSGRPADAPLESGDFVEIQVADVGVGMGEEELAHAFEPFCTTKESGTGLGLSMVYGIVRKAGGEVSIASAPGRGTVVTILLPRAPAPIEEAEPFLQADPVRGGTERVLVVEDDPLVRELATRVLTVNG